MAIPRFQGGPRTVRDKLNELVDAVNFLSQLRGDEVFIRVNRGPAGSVVSLAIDQVLCRIPKIGTIATANVTASFALITSKMGTEPPYRYVAAAAVMDEDGDWTEAVGADAVEYATVYNMEEQGAGGQWVNPLTVGDVVLIFSAPGTSGSYVCTRAHYRGTY